MKVAVLDDYQDAVRHLRCFSRVQQHDVVVFTDNVKGVDRLAARLHDATAIVLMRERTRVTREVLERLPNLKLLSQTGRGVAHVDLDACTRHGVIVSAADVSNPSAPAELTWALILASLRHVPYEVKRLKEGYWQSTLGVGLRGKTLGVFGLGRIGRLVAEAGRAFGMQILVWGRQSSLDTAGELGYSVAGSKRALFENADVLSLHVTLNDKTRGIVSLDDLLAMKETALLVNTSRAELISAGALVQALREGRPGYAAVDVYEEEPVLGAAHPLLGMDNALCTPHLGVVEETTYELYFGIAFDQVNAFAAGKPINVLNSEVLNVAAAAAKY